MLLSFFPCLSSSRSLSARNRRVMQRGTLRARGHCGVERGIKKKFAALGRVRTLDFKEKCMSAGLRIKLHLYRDSRVQGNLGDAVSSRRGDLRGPECSEGVCTWDGGRGSRPLAPL